jgi:hypothetical protein
MNAQVTAGFNATASSVEAEMWAANEAVARHLPPAHRVVPGNADVRRRHVRRFGR